MICLRDFDLKLIPPVETIACYVYIFNIITKGVFINLLLKYNLMKTMKKRKQLLVSKKSDNPY
jgi:hypothetical protein